MRKISAILLLAHILVFVFLLIALFVSVLMLAVFNRVGLTKKSTPAIIKLMSRRGTINVPMNKIVATFDLSTNFGSCCCIFFAIFGTN